MKITQTMFAVFLLLVALTACECNIGTGTNQNSSNSTTNTSTPSTPKEASTSNTSSSSPATSAPKKSPLGNLVEADMGTGYTEDAEAYRIQGAKTVFEEDDPVITCVWKIEDAKEGARLNGVWIAENAEGYKANLKIDEKAIVLEKGNNTGYLSLNRPTNGWPTGRYRVEIFLGDDMVKSVPFRVE